MNQRETLETNLDVMISRYPDAKRGPLKRYGHEFIEAYMRQDYALANMYAALIASVARREDYGKPR